MEQHDFVTELVRTALTILAPILVAALTTAAIQVARKFGLEVGAQQQAKIEHYARQAVLEAEEWAAQRIRANLPTTPMEKFERALRGMLQKVPGVTAGEATAIIHAVLPQVGAGAAAALGEVRRAATNEAR
jgi:hypothetical protein